MYGIEKENYKLNILKKYCKKMFMVLVWYLFGLQYILKATSFNI